MSTKGDKPMSALAKLFELDYQLAINELIKLLRFGICGKCGANFNIIDLRLNRDKTKLYVTLECTKAKHRVKLSISNYSNKVLYGKIALI